MYHNSGASELWDEKEIQSLASNCFLVTSKVKIFTPVLTISQRTMGYETRGTEVKDETEIYIKDHKCD